MPDTWEVLNNLNPQVSSGIDGWNADPDYDGINNLQEYLNGLKPNASDKPGKPGLASPEESTQVKENTPFLSFYNSIDPNGLSLKYDIKIYKDKLCSIPFDSGNNIISGNIITSWKPSKPLVENNFYWWRGRAKNKYIAGEWSDIFSFWVNVYEEKPTTPVMDYPSDSAIIDKTSPT